MKNFTSSYQLEGCTCIILLPNYKLEVKKYQITFEITNWKTKKTKILISTHSHSRFFYGNDILCTSEYLKRILFI